MRNFLLGIILTLIVFIGGPLLFEQVDWIAGLQDHGVLVLAITGIGLVVKLIFTRIATGDFTYEKYGFDNCVISFGGIMTAFVFQLSSKDDHFPGIQSTPLKYISFASNSDLGNRSLQLASMFLIILVFTLITALIVREIKDDKIKLKALAGLLSTLMGIFVLAMYVLILVLKK